MSLSPVAREAFILDSMSQMAGGLIASAQELDRVRRVLGSVADEVLAKQFYEFSVELADRYDIENP